MLKILNKIKILLIILFISFNTFASGVNTPSLEYVFIEYLKKIKNITLKYDIHPFLVMGIAMQESSLQPLVININRIDEKLSKKKCFELLNLFHQIVNTEKVDTGKIRLTLKLYNNNTYIGKKNYCFQNNKNNDFIIKDFYNSNNFNTVRLYSNSPVPVRFNNILSASNYTNKIVNIIDNVDVGMTQINNKYWLAPNNIPPALLFDSSVAIELSAQILASLRAETDNNIYKMLKYYHSRNRIGDRYAKSVIKNINIFNTLFNSYLANNDLKNKINKTYVALTSNDTVTSASNNMFRDIFTQNNTKKLYNKKGVFSYIVSALAKENIINLN